MIDLFDIPLIPGLATTCDFLDAAEERELIAAIDTLDLSPFRFHQWTGKRLTRGFGWSYDFQSGTLSRAEPLPDWLLAIRDRAAGFAGLAPEEMIQALVTRYDAGAGIGWHRDRPIYEDVVGISLGAPAAMRFRRRRGQGKREQWQRATVPLGSRGIYRLSGEVRHDWEHSIAEVGEARHSITFRSFSDAGRKQSRAG